MKVINKPNGHMFWHPAIKMAVEGVKDIAAINDIENRLLDGPRSHFKIAETMRLSVLKGPVTLDRKTVLGYIVDWATNQKKHGKH